MNQTNQIDQMSAERAVDHQSVGSRLRLTGEDSCLNTQYDVIMGHTQPEPPPGCQALGWLLVNAMGAPAPRDPELRLPPSLVRLVALVYLVHLVCLILGLGKNQINETNQMNPTDETTGVTSS